jgi:hypothetical protein
VIELKRMSDEAFCMDAKDVDHLYRRHCVTKVVEHITGEKFERPMLPVKYIDRVYWADARTGSLYSQSSGLCMSSEYLRLVA